MRDKNRSTENKNDRLFTVSAYRTNSGQMFGTYLSQFVCLWFIKWSIFRVSSPYTERTISLKI